MPRRDYSFADKNYMTGGLESLILRDFCDPGSSYSGEAEIPFLFVETYRCVQFVNSCGYYFAFGQVVDTILLFGRSWT